MSRAERKGQNMSKHTPGPWHVGVVEKMEVLSDHGRLRLEPGGTTLYPICKVVMFDREEDEANARLIAAAPEMYEALRELLDCDEDAPKSVCERRRSQGTHCRCEGCARSRAWSALHKAEGGA